MSTTKKILIVEDDPQLQEIYQTIFSQEGFHTIPVTDGKQGLFMVKSQKPDLVLLDLMLPGGMNGFDVLEEIKRNEETKNIPVIIMTNLDSEAKMAKKIGCDYYFIKSNVQIEEIIKVIKKMLA